LGGLVCGLQDIEQPPCEFAALGRWEIREAGPAVACGRNRCLGQRNGCLRRRNCFLGAPRPEVEHVAISLRWWYDRRDPRDGITTFEARHGGGRGGPLR